MVRAAEAAYLLGGTLFELVHRDLHKNMLTCKCFYGANERVSS